MLSFDRAMSFPGWWAALPVAGTALVLACGSGALVNRVLSKRLLVQIGLISYPLYLWHWPLLTLFLVGSGELLTGRERLGLIGVSFVLAWLTYRFIELPVRRRSDLRRPARWATAMGVVALACVLAAFGLAKPRNDVTGLEKIVAALTDWEFPPSSFQQRFFQGARFFEQRSMLGATVLFIGDSNVEQFAPRVADLLSARPGDFKSVVFATKGGCLPIPGWNPPKISCEDRLKVAREYAHRVEVDTVVLGGSWVNLHEFGESPQALAPMGELIRDLVRSGKKTYLVLNIPAGPSFDPRHMFGGSRLTRMTPVANPPPFERTSFLASYGPLRDELRALAEKNGAIVVDPLEALCPGRTCATVSPDGRPLYLDEHHMRPFYARASATFLDPLLRQQAP